MSLYGSLANFFLSGKRNMLKSEAKNYQVLCLSCIMVLDNTDAKVSKPQFM